MTSTPDTNRHASSAPGYMAVVCIHDRADGSAMFDSFPLNALSKSDAFVELEDRISAPSYIMEALGCDGPESAGGRWPYACLIDVTTGEITHATATCEGW